MSSDGRQLTASYRYAVADRSGADEDRALARVPAWCTCLVRRCADVVGASILLALSAPAWPIIALIIKLDSPGPVLVSQLRGGYREKPFRLHKFRSMRDTPVPQDQDSTGTRKERSMSRTTRFGRILRCTSLDELPQLLNVLWGHMSLIGPRPLVFDDLADPLDIARAEGGVEPDTLTLWRSVRCQVRPGLTGLWQINGRSDLPLEGLLRYDAEYVQRCSLRLDLAILLRTIPVVLRGIGAF